MKTKKANKLVAFMLSATMAMTAFAADVHAEEASGAWKMGNNTYETLQTAIDAAGGEAATIELLRDANGNGAKVPSGKNITIDFNQHAYDITGDLVGSTGTATQALQLLKGSTVTLKNGEIKSSEAKMLVQNYANLTIDHMKLDGSALNAAKPYTLSNNCGNVVIKDSELIAKAGGYSFDVYYWPTFGYTEGVTVSVERNSVITGDIEYDSDGSEDGKANVAEKAKLNIKGGSFSGKFVTSGLNDDGKTGISISGGSFAIKPAEDYLAEGFHLNEDGSVLEDGAEEKAALETLKAAIAAADTAYDETKTYTQASKDAFNAAYAAAKDLVDDEDATAEAMTNAAAALNEAVANLEEDTAAVDAKTQLAEKISEAEKILKNGNAYTEDSLKALKDALTAAKALADDADDATVTAALSTLSKAIEDLEPVETPSLDLTKLNEAIEAANKMLQEAIDSGLYADAIIKECKLAIKAAETLRDSAKLQSQIDEGIKALDEAMKNLVPNEEPGTDPEPDTEEPATKPSDKDNAAIKNTASTPNTGDHTTAVASLLLLVCAGAYLGFNYKRKVNNA